MADDETSVHPFSISHGHTLTPLGFLKYRGVASENKLGRFHFSFPGGNCLAMLAQAGGLDYDDNSLSR